MQNLSQILILIHTNDNSNYTHPFYFALYKNLVHNARAALIVFFIYTVFIFGFGQLSRETCLSFLPSDFVGTGNQLKTWSNALECKPLTAYGGGRIRGKFHADWHGMPILMGMVDLHDHGDDWHKYYLLQADKFFFKNENVNCGKLIVSD